MYFPVTLAKFLGMPFLQNTSKRLLLKNFTWSILEYFVSLDLEKRGDYSSGDCMFSFRLLSVGDMTDLKFPEVNFYVWKGQSMAYEIFAPSLRIWQNAWERYVCRAPLGDCFWKDNDNVNYFLVKQVFTDFKQYEP